MFLEIKFEGGLGNQLFQYAAGRSLCIKKRIPYLLFNTDSYINQPLGRAFALGNLQVKGEVIKNSTVNKIFRRHTKLNKIFTALGLHHLIEEKGFVLQPLENNTRFLTSLKGYWQSAWYFEEVREILLNEFRPKQIPVLPGWIKHTNTVAVHVRRTDYLLEPRYGFVGETYYRQAIDLIKGKLKDPLFVFFSDDLDWCKSSFLNERAIYCEDEHWREDYQQLHLMSNCAHQVIANSSFSWWGAWLNTNPEKIVIRPANPFKEKSLLYESHYPGSWIAVENNI
jgi:hypothetical protein